MDSMQLGAFIAQLRKEQNMTQRELAELLHVTDKAVSKWETGKGFPDVTLMSPLAQALGVSLVELIQGARSTQDSLSMEEAGAVVSQAMDQSQKSTACRYLRLLRWLLTLIGLAAAYQPLVLLAGWIYVTVTSTALGVIGGGDTVTTIVTASPDWFPVWLWPALLAVAALACLLLALRVHRLERKLR